MKIFTLIAFALIGASRAFAADTKSVCTMGWNQNPQGHVKLVLHAIDGRPDLALIEVDLVSQTVDHGSTHQPVRLIGLLSARLNQRGQILAEGTLENANTGANARLINPESIVVQGQIDSQGNIRGSLNDENRILQLGYGVPLSCETLN